MIAEKKAVEDKYLLDALRSRGEDVFRAELSEYLIFELECPAFFIHPSRLSAQRNVHPSAHSPPVRSLVVSQ